MAANNFKVFNESKTNIMNDTDYGNHIQRENGVVSGVANSTLHNKLYRQTSIVAKAVADFVASQELDATDNDSILFSTNLKKALEKVTKLPLDGHRTQGVLDHPDQSVTTPKVKDLAITEGKLAKDSVTEAKIKDLSVTTSKINDKSVTINKVDEEVKKYLVDTYIKKSGDIIDGDLIFKGSKGSIYFNTTNSVSAKVQVNNNGTLDIGVNESTNQAVDNIALCSMNKPHWYNINSGHKSLATDEDVANAVAKKVSKAGDTMTGNLSINTGTELSSVSVSNATGGKLLFESMAQNIDYIGKLIYNNGLDTEAILNLPKKTGSIITSVDFNPLKDLVGFGGIVAQKLETNGYIKFANGVTIQWGNATSPVKFPIAFSTACLNVVATLQTNGDDGNMSKNRLYVNNISNAGFSIQNPQGSYRYFAVGY